MCMHNSCSRLFSLSLRTIALVLLLLSAATLAAVFISQYGFGLEPCELCIYQRWPYAVIIVLTAIALLVTSNSKLQRVLLWLCVAALLAGGGIAAYHTGVEQGIFAGPDACSEDEMGDVDSIEDLREKILGKQAVRCDKPAIELWGIITMASVNMVLSFVLAFWAAISIHNTGAGRKNYNDGNE